jgi:hypothetical protein
MFLTKTTKPSQFLRRVYPAAAGWSSTEQSFLFRTSSSRVYRCVQPSYSRVCAAAAAVYRLERTRDLYLACSSYISVSLYYICIAATDVCILYLDVLLMVFIYWWCLIPQEGCRGCCTCYVWSAVMCGDQSSFWKTYITIAIVWFMMGKTYV